MDDQESLHSHYHPGERCIPITPQAVRRGWVFPVYVTDTVWGTCISWRADKHSSADKRIYELIDAVGEGMGKALSASPDAVSFKFKHWHLKKDRPKAKKKAKSKFAARLLLDPETNDPWVIIFDPTLDHEGVLTYGEYEEHRADEELAGGEPSGGEAPSGLDPSGSP